MPGPYAHITLVQKLDSSGMFDEVMLPVTGARTINDELFKYCLLGAVSPDYPNLATNDVKAPLWADAMHYSHTGEMVIRGIQHLKQMREPQQARCLAWLLGYCSHIVADVTIHPVVQLKVGEYTSNVFQHRRCELHQDMFAFKLMNSDRIGQSPDLNSMLAGCCHDKSRRLLAMDISSLWADLLLDCHPGLYQENPPDIHGWHRDAIGLVQAGEKERFHLFPLARIIAAKTGLTYPVDGPDSEFIEGLTIPGGGVMGYGEIFGKAVENVSAAWVVVADAVHGNGTDYLTWFGEWGLDSGCDEHGQQVFW
jgi:hypothetical protein